VQRPAELRKRANPSLPQASLPPKKKMKNVKKKTSFLTDDQLRTNDQDPSMKVKNQMLKGYDCLDGVVLVVYG
jgi:hypothetical protein